MDNRKALGDHNPAPEMDEYGWPMEPTGYKNQLPGPYPYDRDRDAKPDIPYTGSENPAICANRPIADMSPDHGSGDINRGLAFRVPLGDPDYDDKNTG